jgi:hypothetical protein
LFFGCIITYQGDLNVLDGKIKMFFLKYFLMVLKCHRYDVPGVDVFNVFYVQYRYGGIFAMFKIRHANGWIKKQLT